MGASLIIAIGAQNAFVLRLGIIRSHIFAVALVCSLSDALLIAAGVAGVGTFMAKSPGLIMIVTIVGSGFLFIYGLMAFMRAFNPGQMNTGPQESGTLKSALLTVLALTFLNPHVYLDTVLLIGGLSARLEPQAKLAYAAGAISASFVWFFTLGYAARLLAPIFSHPKSWRVLDVLIGLVMWMIAASLISDLLSQRI